MTTDDIKRLYFYERQFLGARDFQDEQEYHIEMRRRHLIAHHRWGIVGGLEIKQDPNSLVWYVAPGMAVDGFGREIIVFEPEPLNTNAIADQLAGADMPALLKVWIAYQVEKAKRPPQNYQVCDNAEQFMRVRETFRLVYQKKPPFDLEQADDPNKQDADYWQTWPHAYQDLPDDPKQARWPIYLGTLVWNTDPGDPSQNLITSVDPADPKDNQRRRYVGLVGEEIEAPDGRLLIRARGDDTPLPDGAGGVEVRLEGRLEVVRQLTADANLNVEGKVGIGLKNPDPDTIKDVEPDTRLQVDGGKAASLKEQTGYVVVGAIEDRNLVMDDRALMARENKAVAELELQSGGGDLSVHRQNADAALIVTDGGNVGVGTLKPDAKLEIAGGGDLLLRAPQKKVNEPGSISFKTFTGAQKAKIWSGPDTGNSLLFSSGDETADLMIDAAGNVGIGTVTPESQLEVAGEVHSSGDSAGFSFANRETKKFVQNPINGERWVWYADKNHARLWSGDDKVIVDDAGNVFVSARLVVDYDDLNDGHYQPGVSFGPSGGEAIASKRTDGGNKYGLDFYTNASSRMSLTHDGDLGVGTHAPKARVHVVDSKAGDASDLSSHVAVIENSSGSDNADVLALRVGITNPGTANNYITFFDGSGSIGSIERNTSPVPGEPTITFGAPGGDYAEWLPRLEAGERMEAGDIVGVHAGHVTKRTEGADQLLVISTRPIVLGNMPPPGEKHLYERVAFLGQVRVRVRGPVRAGDYITASGSDDGAGRALPPAQLFLSGEAQIVGRAWESAEEEGIHQINVAVGLAGAGAEKELLGLLGSLRGELAALKAELEELRAAKKSV
jgi:hypothetical protein